MTRTPIDDSDIYSGVSNTFGNEAPDEEQTKVSETQANETEALKVNAKFVADEIEARRKAIVDIRSYLQENVKDAKAIEIEFRARELHLEFLEELGSSIAIRLREQK